MADKKAQAQQVYGTICAALDDMGWTYQKDGERLAVFFGVNGDFFQMDMVIVVEEEQQALCLLSELPFHMSEDKLVEGAVAVCQANYNMADGGFDYSLKDGRISFRVAAAYHNSTIGKGLVKYLIKCACVMVEKHGKDFFALNNGTMSLSEFMTNE